MQTAEVVVGGTLPVEGIAEPLRFWLDELGLAAAPCLTDASTPERLVDAARSSGATAALFVLTIPDVAGGETAAASYAARLRDAAATLDVPLVVCAAPFGDLAAAEAVLERELAQVAGVSFVSTSKLARISPGLPPSTDPDEPGTAICAAIATATARMLAARRGHGRKVIVLDCDDTLWCGQCAEDGADGVVLDDAAVALQRFVAARREQGMLLCLCSKNAEEDVEAVFGARAEMPLRRSDFVAARINWLPKAENLRSLARELGVGLDSLVFVDDDPLQCADVEARCPEVLTVLLPRERSEVEELLDAIWALDPAPRTAEDERRTELYRDHLAREQARAAAFSLEDFLRTLGLEVTVRPLEPADAPRVSQLTRRTNQFNCFRHGRDEAEVLAHRAREDAGCLVAELRDRFGDYGLIGVAMFVEDGGRLLVDSLLVSCRALGRGVEHALLRELAAEAGARNAEEIVIRFEPTARNEPARAFLATLDGAGDWDAAREVHVSVAHAKSVRQESEVGAQLSA